MLILVRHGEANHHTEDLTGGWTDSSLTPKGEKQLAEAGLYLKNLLAGQKPFILASDLQRALSSAEIIAGFFGVQVETACFLREKNNGQAAGKSNAEAQALKLARTLPDPDHRNYPGGETRREFFSRVKAGMQPLKFSQAEPLVLVAHKGTLQNILFWWLGLSIDQVCELKISFDILPASINILQVNKWREREISLLNYTAF